jgi:hypothetical protein
MAREALRLALDRRAPGLVAGVSWLPAHAESTFVEATAVDFAFVHADMTGARDAVAQLQARDVAAVWAVAGPLGRLAGELGWVEVIRSSAGEPGSLAAPLAEALHAALESARAGLSTGADVVLVADDLAGSAGPLVSPDFALDALMPCYATIAHQVLADGVPAAFHSDGDVRPVLPALGRAGFSAVHAGGLADEPLLAEVRAARASGLQVIGGITSAWLADDPVERGTHAGQLARKHGLIVCDDGGLTTPDELAAYALALDAARLAYGAGLQP